jgi:hypothetical protein
VPQAFFGIGGLVAERAGKVALVVVRVHANLFTPSLTLPASGREPEEQSEGTRYAIAPARPRLAFVSIVTSRSRR